jgi:selenocysteine lyase/cysteine desulfurase
VITRRDLIASAGLASASLLGGAGMPAPATGKEKAAPEFGFKGVYLDAAFVHPLSRQVRESGVAYFRDRFTRPHSISPFSNPRNAAVGQFARLINCAPQDVAVVPSTLVAENLVNAALQTGPGAGVVTDALHYDASLVLYAERRKQGTPVKVVPVRDNRIDLADIRDALTPDTRLVALSLVSSATGFVHNLAEVCAVAHKSGVLVYADIIQAAGAIPVDVAASGVDFAACGTYKWLMADFGAAFLYVRRDRLERLHRTQIGWRQIRGLSQHISPFDPTVSDLGEYELRDDAAGLFEVGTPAWGALATAQASIASINDRGIDAIARHREPLMSELRSRLSHMPGVVPLTPQDSQGPILAFGIKDAELRFGDRLLANQVQISVYPNAVRISPSIYNSPEDVGRLIAILMEDAPGTR